MLGSVFAKTLRDHRRGLAWWALGLVAFAAYVIGVYPSVRRSAASLGSYVKQMPDALKALFGGVLDFTSAEGYLRTEYFFFMLPLLLLVFAIGLASKETAGEERAGTLETLLANPVARRRVAAEKFAALAVATMGLALVFWAALAVALGCARGSRGLAVGASAAVAVGSYLLNSLAPIVDFLRPYRKLSPFYHYFGADPLARGLNLAHAEVLAGIAAALFVAGLVVFERRDLGV